MKRSAKSRRISWYLPANPSYSLTLLLSVILWSESVGAIPRGIGLHLAQQPSATSQKTIRAADQQASDEGDQLYEHRTAESLRKAIEKWEEALKLWQQVDDKAKQALTLSNIGRVYSDLGDKQKALAYNPHSALQFVTQIQV